MGLFLDKFARALAQGVSRREALRQAFSGATAIAVASALPRPAAAQAPVVCPDVEKTESCRRRRTVNCTNTDRCACVTRAGGAGRACIKRRCGSKCTTDLNQSHDGTYMLARIVPVSSQWLWLKSGTTPV